MTSTISKSSKHFTSLLHTSSPGHIKQTLGGVGRNVCEAAMRTGAPAFLVSAVGDDLAAQTVRQGMQEIGMVSSSLFFFSFLLFDHLRKVYDY